MPKPPERREETPFTESASNGSYELLKQRERETASLFSSSIRAGTDLPSYSEETFPHLDIS